LGDLSIRGDTELAHQFGKVLGAMEIDWQARLTPYTGSLLADDLVAIAGTLHGWGLEVAQGVSEDVTHFLQQDQALVPDKETTGQFLEAVDQLRDDVERLEARIKLLEHNNNRGTS